MSILWALLCILRLFGTEQSGLWLFYASQLGHQHQVIFLLSYCTLFFQPLSIGVVGM